MGSRGCSGEGCGRGRFARCGRVEDERTALCEDDGALDGVLKLANIARPILLGKLTGGNRGEFRGLRPRRLAAACIDTLSPNNRFVLALNTLPIANHIPYHSIIGDRGRGDTPNSSDGVVPYWSSHLEGAQSERIVPSPHGAHQNKQGMEEVH